MLTILLTLTSGPGGPAGAATAKPDEVAGLCDQAAARAARRQGVPLDVMQAITRTETGRAGVAGFQPWPWTVNMEGRGVWFAGRAEAREFLEKHFARGARSFDVGCFQLNYRWHGAVFGSVSDMLDPDRNAAYAARFLKRLHDEFGDWTAAAGAYHSRTPEFATRYATRFDRIRRGLNGDRATTIAVAPPPHISGPGPLIASGRGTLGSLVPVPGPGAPRAVVLFSLESRIASLAETEH